MITAARKYNRIVQIGTQNRSAPYVHAARDYIKSGELGEIHLVKVFNLKANSPFHNRNEPFVLGASEQPPEELDWDLWLGGAPVHPYHETVFAHHGWIAFWDFSAGDMDDAVHQMDIAVLLMGEQTPTAVSSSGGRYHYRDDNAETPDMLVSTYEFDNFIMTLELSGYPRYMQKTSTTIRRNDEFPYWTQNATRVELYGSKELMIVGRMGGGWVTMTSGGKVVEKMYGRIPDAVHRHNFLECIKSRKQPNGDVEVVHNSTNLVHMANIAHRIGNQKLQFDAGSEAFVDNPPANDLRRCKYRKGYEVPEVDSVQWATFLPNVREKIEQSSRAWWQVWIPRFVPAFAGVLTLMNASGWSAKEMVAIRWRANQRSILRSPSPRSFFEISFPWASMARTKHEATGLPSNMTVQVPHSPSLQPFFVPVRPKFSRNTSSKVLRTSISSS